MKYYKSHVKIVSCICQVCFKIRLLLPIILCEVANFCVHDNFSQQQMMNEVLCSNTDTTLLFSMLDTYLVSPSMKYEMRYTKNTRMYCSCPVYKWKCFLKKKKKTVSIRWKSRRLFRCVDELMMWIHHHCMSSYFQIKPHTSQIWVFNPCAHMWVLI